MFKPSKECLSPDGNQVAFSDGPRSAKDDIYIKLVGPGEPIRLTTDPLIDDQPAWSPDGRSICVSCDSGPQRERIRRSHGQLSPYQPAPTRFRNGTHARPMNSGQDLACTQPESSTTKSYFLLVLAEEDVIGSIRNERLLPDIARRGASVGRGRSPVCV